jgi:predicted dehydrogenase
MLVTESKLPLKKEWILCLLSRQISPTSPAIMALEYGFNVLIDKPMTLTLDEAKHLQRKVKETGLVFCLNTSGYPMVKQARKMVAENQFEISVKLWSNTHKDG